MNSAPQQFRFSTKAKGLFIVMILIGLVSTFLGKAGYDSHRFWSAYLLNYYFWLCISLSGIFFAALQHITGAYWSVTVRRIPETFIAFLPVAVVLFIGLLFGLHDLYEWTHTHVVEQDPILSQKTAYLNVPFFIIRSVALFLLIGLLGGKMIRNSLKQDSTGDAKLTRQNVKLSAIFMLLFGWIFTFVAIDLMMSLEPHWFSTIFGIYCWSGLFYSGLATITLWVLFLKKAGPLQGFVTDDHLHDLGKFMFGFTIFWTYIGFSQFMLIWYGNLPEETFYYIDRLQGGWKCVSIALVLVKFVFPFFALISRSAKRNHAWLAFMAFWFLGAQLLDAYWMIYPTHFKEPVFGFFEVGMFIGFAGLFLFSVSFFLSRVSPVAIKDPQIEASLHHHQ